MNKNRYRLIFNKARGLWMAVAEIVRACGKTASPVTGAPEPSSVDHGLHGTLQPLCLAMLLVWGGLLIIAPLAQAEIVADPTAATGQRPEVTQAANGVTQVNIQRPGATGVSHNMYQRFDVDAQGALLNNARTPVKTQLAGWVNGNPNLVGGTARIILNEVNSADPSVLRGYLEVAGDRAQVIVANPSGITCSGCGFINASRSTLSTGRSLFDNGNLNGFEVSAGEILIEGNGLDGSGSDYTDLIARAVTVNAGIWTKELNLIAGTHQVDMHGAIARELNTGTSQPRFAVDVKALGGMYADKIILIGTEDGVGVRNAGQIGAPAGQLQLSVDGRLENSGTLAAQHLQLSLTGALDNSGVLSAGNDLNLQTGGRVDNQGMLYAARDTTIVSDTGITNKVDIQGRGGVISSGQDLSITVRQPAGVLDNQVGATLAAGIKPDGSQGQAGSLQLSVNGVLQGQGHQSAAQQLTLNAASINLDGGHTQAEAIHITAVSGDISNRAGQIYARQQVTLDAVNQPSQTLDNHQGHISADQLQIRVGQLNNSGGVLINTGRANSQITATGTLNNRDGRIASNSDQLNLATNLLDNRQGRIESSATVQLTSGEMDNRKGDILGERLRINTQQQSLDNRSGQLVAQHQLNLQTGALNNSGGLLQSGDDMAVDTGTQTLDNSATASVGGINSQGALTLKTGYLNNANGYIGASGPLTAQAGRVDNSNQGLLLSEQQLSLTGSAINNRQGSLQSKGDQTLSLSSMLDNQGGTLLSEAQLNLQAAVLDNRTTLQGTQGVQAKDLQIAIDQLYNQSGRLLADQSLQVQAGTVLNNQDGQLSGSDSVNVTTAKLDNSRGSIQAGNWLTLSTTDLINVDTQIGRQGLQADNIDLAFVNFDNQQGRLLANQQLNLRGSGQLDNRKGLLSSVQTLQLVDTQSSPTLQVVNDQGRFMAGAQLQLNSYSLQGDGELLALGDLNLSLVDDLIQQGDLITNGNLTLSLLGDLTNSGKLAAGGTLSLAAVNIDNGDGSEVGAPVTRIQASGSLNNQGLIDGRQTRITATLLDNFGNGRIYGDQLAIQATTLNNRDLNQRAAVIASRGDLDLGVTTLNNANDALIFSAGDLRVGGSLDSNDRVTGKASQLTNSSSGIESLGELQISANQLLNQNAGFRKDRLHTLVNQSHSERSYVNSEDYYERTYLRNEYEEVIAASDPGRVVSAGNMTLDVDQVVNDKSHIIAGGTLILNTVQLDNLDTTLEKSQEDAGQERFSWIEYCRFGKSKCRRYGPYAPYQPPAKITTASATLARVEQQSVQPVNNPGLSAHQVDSINLILPTADNSIDAAQTVSHSLVAQLQLALTAQHVTLSSANGNGQNPVVRTGGQLLQLPRNTLFSYQTSPSHSVLIETDPRFANYHNWLSSDYMLDQLQMDPANTMKRLGDGFSEQRLVQQQITQLTGQRYLAGYQSDEEQFKALMNAGVTFALAYDLKPGIALTTEQMAHLTSDLVWLVEQTVVLNDGSRHTVLVPQLYAVLEPGDINGQGALLGGEQVALNLSGDLLNQGTVQAVDRLNLSAVNIHNRRGSFSARSTELSATQDIDNEAGLMQGRDRLVVQAGRDFTVRAATREGLNQVGASQFERIHLDGIGTLQVLNPEGRLVASAGRDLTLTSAAVINEGEGGATQLNAGRDLQLDTTETRMRDAIVWDSGNYRTEDLRREIGSVVQTEGDLTLSSGNDINSRAAQISSNGHLRALAEGDIAIDHSINTDHNARRQVIQSSGFLSSKTTIDESRSTTRSVQASTLSADDITLQAGQDLTITGSQVVATESANLNAGGDLTIQSGQQTSESYSYHQLMKSGLFASDSGFGITLGNLQKSDEVDQQQTTRISSTVGALNGDININAAGDLAVTASDLLARQGSIRLGGANITLDSAFNTQGQTEEHKRKQSGLTLAISGGIVDTLQTIKSSVERIDSAGDGRLKALHAWRVRRIANNLPDQFDKLDHLTEDFQDPTNANNTPQSSGINLSLSLGSSASEQHISQSSQTALGSSLIANDQIQIIARGSSGNGNPGSPEEEISGGDITLRGALLEADQITLNAANELNLTSAENHNDYNETSKSKSSGIGISIGSDGLLFFVEGSRSRGLVNQSDDRYLETLINAKEKATLISTSDTTLQGAQVNAKRIEVNSGGDLNIISQQDEEHFKKRNQSIGGRVGIGYGKMSVSLNYSKLKADSDYVAVQEQSGLFAGEEGFDVQVAKNTKLHGGAIVSSSGHENNRFSTDALSYNAIDNHAKYEVESKSISFSTSGSSGPTKGFGGGASSDSGEAQNTTYAAISEGDITIRSNPNQSLDELKRSKEEAHRVLERIFSEDKVDQARETAELTQVFAEEAYIAIGALYKPMEDTEALLKHERNKENPNQAIIDLLEKSLAAQEANLPISKPIAHAIAGGLTAVLGGGNFMQGAMAAGLSETAAGQLAEVLPENKTLRNLAATMIGGAVSGSMGALISGTADKFNRQLHQTEIELIQANAEIYALRQNWRLPDGSLDTDRAITILTLNALNRIDADWSTAEHVQAAYDPSAEQFLDEIAGMVEPRTNGLAWFQYSPDEFYDSALFADKVFPGIADQDITEFSGESGPLTPQELETLKGTYLKFYQQYAATGAALEADTSAASYMVEKVDQDLSNLVDALTSKETYQGIWAYVESVAESDKPIEKFASDNLNALKGNHTLSEAVQGLEFQAALAEMRGEPDLANKMRGEAYAVLSAKGLEIVATVAPVNVADVAADLARNIGTIVAVRGVEVLEKAAWKALIKSGGVIDPLTGKPLLDFRKLTNHQKGSIGELFGPHTVKQIIPNGEKLARVPGIGETGIDDLYKVDRPDVDYVIVEYKFVGPDGKTGASALGRTNDGRQGSEAWTLGSGRLQKAAGDEYAISIENAVKMGRTETWVIATRPDGATEVQVLDSLGKTKNVNTSTILLSRSNLSGVKP